MRLADLSPANRARLVPLETHPGFHGLVPAPPLRMVDTRPVSGLLNAAHEGLAAAKAERLPNPDLVTRTLDRREAVRSSQMEGTRSEIEDVLSYEATGSDEGLPADVATTVNYVTALQAGLAAVREKARPAFSVSLIQEIHRRLMAGDRSYADPPGQIRQIQNWIGGLSIADALVVPPPSDRVAACLEDLRDYLVPTLESEEGRELSIVVRVALAHVHFELVHPFRDGNGRVGRILMPLMLAAEGYPPVYLAGALKSRHSDYSSLLRGAQLRDEILPWIGFVAEAIRTASDQSIALARALQHVQAGWEDAVSAYRSHSTIRRMSRLLVATPVVTVGRVAATLGVTFPAANAAVSELVKLGILTPGSKRKRDRVFVARGVIEILER